MARRRRLILAITLLAELAGFVLAVLLRDTLVDRAGALTSTGTVFAWAAALGFAVLVTLLLAAGAKTFVYVNLASALVLLVFTRSIDDSKAWLALGIAMLVLLALVAFQPETAEGRRRVLFTSTVVIVLGAFVATLISSARPELGLDLKGGVSVRLFPVKGTDPALLPTTRQIIENRVNGLGVAEPDVSVQGNTIVVDIPGVKDRARAEQLVGTTAELQNRPVIAGPFASGEPLTSTQPTTTTTAPGATTTTKPGATTTTKPGATTTTKPPKAGPGSTSTTAKGNGAAPRERTIATTPIAAQAAATTTTKPAGATTTKPSATTTTPGVTTTTKAGTTPTTAGKSETCSDLVPKTPVASTQAGFFWSGTPDKSGHYPACYYLDKSVLPGNAVTSASASYQPSGDQAGWGVDVTYRGDSFVTAVAQPYVNKQVAIVLDNIVLSAPTINPGITGSDVRISGSFTEKAARDLALGLKYGSLPVRFDEKQQTVENVSPSLGKDQLRAGIAAGIIGLALVALYMLFFYRLLGFVVWVGLALTGMIMFTIVTLLGSAQGLTLTLSGVTGIIVSVGVTVDSYVVYFERLKDEVRTGKTVRSSVDTGWKRAWRTIVAADAVSLIGAGVLYALTIGSVKGFAYFLALSTIVDLVLAWCYMHPLVSMLARRQQVVAMRGMGIATGLDVAGGDSMSVTETAREPRGLPGVPGVDRRHRPSDFFHERTNFAFIAKSKRYLVISLVVVIGGLLVLAVRGLNLGIDFEGGVSWQVDVAKSVTPKVGDVRSIVSKAGVSDFKATIGSNPQNNRETIRVQARVVDDPSDLLRRAVANATHRPLSAVDFTHVGNGGRVTVDKVTKPNKDAVQSAVAKVAAAGAKSTVDVTNQRVVVNVDKLPASTVDKVSAALLQYARATQQDLSISTVGPTWGSQVSHKALQALIVFFLVLAVYLTLRFEFKMAAAAIAAVLHDIIFTVAVYAITQFTVSPATVTAFLTILGFSLYDTVVVFDKIKENQTALVSLAGTRGMTYGAMANRSLNQVLMRSLSTSFVALMPVLSLLVVGSGIFGATALEDFALALFAGLFIGTYSSIFVATPLLVWWKEREPQYRALRERAERLGATTPAAAPVRAAAKPKLVRVPDAPSDGAALGNGDGDGDTGPATPSDWDTSGVPGPAAVGRSAPPRPRQQRGKKRKR